MTASHRIPRALGVLVAAVVLVAPAGASAAPVAPDGMPASVGGDELPAWSWPLTSVRIVRAYQAPAHAYGPGHRGIDLMPLAGDEVHAPQAGVVAFAGRVADRPLLTIDHGGGLVTTFEPVMTALTAGAGVARGDVVGVIGTGGHAVTGTLHFGVRRDGEYINPLLLLGGVPRAVLLPCCG